ncbi:maestro heat-like repeat-containing protein family member 6 isoform X1 [Pipra filicauda]|uniref:Maestro heat-like repeat-containing protein family member 6 isoform X1 n=1 Tax=Pipra filicauda TaxID=649802 RepID=A0A6J2HQI3_9PASS|nr:maestro heat-like repeat-containing protein family member 6 isoform X1 [Pipra filicauda]
MAGRRFSLLRLFRRKKEEESPGAAPAQQPEEVQQVQPPQEDAGQERTEEQLRARGRFRRAAQTFMKFMGSRRRKARITPADVQAQPDTILTQLTKPDVSTASTAVPAKCDTATSDLTTHWDTTSTDDVSHCDSVLPGLTEEADATTTEGVASTDAAPVQRLADTPSLEFLEERAVSAEVAITPDGDMQQRPPTVPKLAWVKEEEKEESPRAAPAQQPEEVQQVQPPQEDAGQERTEEQLRARGRFRRAAQLVCRFIRCIWHEEATFMATGDTANSDLFNAQTSAALLDMLVENGVYKAKQVPAIVRCIHQWLMSNVSDEHRLDKTLVLLTEEHPMDVAVTLLRSAPACDRAARTMWKTLISSRWTKEPVLQILFRVLEYWPAHRRRTSDGDERDVFALAATVALWEILQLSHSWCPGGVKDNFPRLLLTLLFQVFISTEEMSEEVETFWRRCREQRSLPPNPNRFAVQTVKALLRQLLGEDVLMAIGRKCGWDMLLKADSHHYAVGLLARELCRVSCSFCRSIAVSLLPRLSRGEPLWELPALAFLVEVLHCLNPRQCGPSVLQIISRHLRSQCPERRRLALRGLVVLSRDPAMAKSMRSLSESLLELLQDADTDAVQMTLSAFINVLHFQIVKISTPTALKLLEALRPLFDNEHSQLQQLSMLLFWELMEATERSKSLKPHVYLSLVPFYFNWHNENQRVAEASWRALFGAARFLKWRDLEDLVTMEQPWRFPECLLEKDRSRVGQYVRQALPFLESPEKPLRKLAIKFLGIAARSMKQEQPELQLICQALQDITDDSPAVSNLAQETLQIIRAVRRTSFFHFW